MAASVDTIESPSQVNREVTSFMGTSPLYSPSSDKRYWSNLRSRIDSILEDRDRKALNGQKRENKEESSRAKRLKEDSQLLLRGFDSVAHTLSQLYNNLDSALQGARDLAKPPTFTDIFHSNLNNSENKEEDSRKQQHQEGNKKGLKRKFDSNESSDDQGDDSQKKDGPSPKDKRMKKAKNLAISMATKAATLARELKSIKSDLCFMQERCTLLEEENRRLRDGFVKGIRPEEDDLVRLQLEALLAEKSRLANENASLVRENQCLHQLVEYHQLTSQDLSASYEEFIQGMCLDFSSPSSAKSGETGNDADYQGIQTPRTNIFDLPSTSFNESFREEP
ncbi:hypothetical protein WN943_016969 [Citrus x changshan-huyou]